MDIEQEQRIEGKRAIARAVEEYRQTPEGIKEFAESVEKIRRYRCSPSYGRMNRQMDI